ncbi:hypothetical protein [Clostridium beijerinckii]|uniref:hypothetical protein n=1 Tax=Clostridium beijerinckii TaxID=1520 RepID=UPI00156E496C|nr:hypothetical protein [Clostridium beijerinckii]NRU52379.1 hypothetical protein [Clostridium beijerinckii]NRU52678.1 hypothetical protein [Clostridium beijerinckii]NYC68721.1 hypothetical protein [Clostridium beijerinckii]NYC91870.1 hypothetical protein [Clostridium beijerinckii]
MEELNIIEASNMPYGTEFKVKIDCYYKHDDACRIRDNTKLIAVNLQSGIKFKEYADIERASKTLINAKFIPLQKPVSFMEAINAGLEGKMIKVDVTELNEKYRDIENCTCVLNSYWNNCWSSIKCIFEMLGKTEKHTSKIINEGKWYIKED